MSGGPSIIPRSASEKSNEELINSLISSFENLKQGTEPEGKSLPQLREHSNSREAQNTSFSAWTSHEGDVMYIPSIDFSRSGLAEEKSEYDITVKLFFLTRIPASQRCQHLHEAISLVLKKLHVPSIDLLIVSFPGISFDADDKDDQELAELSKESDVEDMKAMVETWRAIENLQIDGIVLQIGLSEFGSKRLKRFLPYTKIRPSVDQINIRDCCVVPKSLILYARQEKIELLTHNDCTNILPRGTTRELLGTGPRGAGILAGPQNLHGLQGEVEPQWVVKYTAVVRDRGVIENKGYFAMAELQD